MTTPAANTGNFPTITWNKQQWPIPELAPRQLREVRSALQEFNKMIGDTRKSAAGNGSDIGLFTELCVSLSNEDYERLLLKPVYFGLTRAHPTLTWEEFLDVNITDADAVAAWFVVRRQSGLFVFDEAEESGQGEATAA